MRRYLVVLILTVSGGCAGSSLPFVATFENYEALLESFLGVPEADLVSAWGAPTQSYSAANVKVLTYRNVRQAAGNSFSCTTTFQIRDNVVTSYNYEGYDCRAFKSEIPK